MDRSEEARYLHAAILSRPPDAGLIERYNRAVTHCGLGEDRVTQKIVRLRLDAEAIEYALRLRGRGRGLTPRIRILFYLAETQRDYYGEFVNETPMFGRAVWRLIEAVAESGWKLAKGCWLVWRHGLG